MIKINYKDPRPLHEQIEDSMRRLIVSGALSGGDKLESVRELASSLAINPNTIARAYRDLEAQGYIYKVAGRGTFVSEQLPSDPERKKKLLNTFDDTAKELYFLGTDKDELKKRIDNLF